MKKEVNNTQVPFDRNEVSMLMKDFVSDIIKNTPNHHTDDYIHTIAEDLTNGICEAYFEMEFPKINVKMCNPMKIGAILEENAKPSKNDRGLQEVMLDYMSDLAFFYHKELYADDEEEISSRASMLDLASTLLFLNYGIDLKLGNMIDSQTHVALSRATMAIRDECCRFLKSREFLDYLKRKNIAFLQDGDNLIIQLLSGSFNVSNGKYEFDHILSVDGICLDPSMKGWDMIMFLMYT